MMWIELGMGYRSFEIYLRARVKGFTKWSECLSSWHSAQIIPRSGHYTSRQMRA